MFMKKDKYKLKIDNIDIVFVGESTKEIIKNDNYKLLHSNLSHKNDLEQIINIIRDILKDYKELYLSCHMKMGYFDFEEIVITNREVISYSIRTLDKVNELEEFWYELTYDVNEDYNLEGIFNTYIDLTQDEKEELINKAKLKIANINNIKEVNYSFDETFIFLIYKLFYKKYPDFQNETNRLNMHSLMYLLKELGFPMKYDDFTIINNHVLSLTLKEKLDDMKKYGEIKKVNRQIKLASELCDMIDVLSSNLKNVNLPTFCYIHYKLEYVLNDVKNISKFDIENIDDYLEIINKLKRLETGPILERRK